jgi:hypothetical protein
MSNASASTPPWILFYGQLGLIPFFAPSLLGWFWPTAAALAASALAIYAALILSFLGGGRWGMALQAPSVDNRVVSLAMLPSLAGFALLLLSSEYRGWQLAGLAAAHMLQGAWDLRAATVPTWYAGLRGRLTLAAVLGLVLGIVVFAT